MKRKILSLILVFAMTVSLLTVGTGAVEPTYGDTAGHWAESSIERWSAYGIIQGSNGEFDPNGQLTCAQLATILAKLLKLPAAKDAGFTDNTADAWYYDAINRCAAAGILNGNGDGTVTPEAPITRERAMVMLARALGIEPIRKPDLTKYTDAAQVSAYAQGYVAALIEAGIVGGVTADQLAPQNNINRASTVTILDRAISTYADKAGATVKADGKGLVLVVADDVTVTGSVDKLLVPANDIEVTVKGSKNIDDITVSGDNSKVILDNASADNVTLDGEKSAVETKNGAKIDNVIVTENAPGATVDVGSGTTVGNVENHAEDATVTGSGTVKKVESDKDITVETKNTDVKNIGDEKITVTDKSGKDTTIGTTGSGSSTTVNKGTTSSGGGYSHSHSYDTSKWVFDDTKHWHASTCGHNLKIDEAAHTFTYADNGNGTHTKSCSACSYSATEAHSYDESNRCVCGLVKPNEGVVASVKAADGICTYYSTLPEAVAAAADGATVTLVKGAETNSLKAGITYDLNGYKLTYTSSGSFSFSNQTTSFIGGAKGGTLDFPNISSTNSAIWANAGATLNVSDITVTCNGSAFYPAGNATALNITNCNVSSSVYCVGTNASSTDNYGVIITLKDSKFTSTASNGDSTAVIVNVACKLVIDNCELTAGRQGLIVRAGTATVTNSTIKTTGTYEVREKYYEALWSSGNEVPAAALTVGNYAVGAANAYLADAIVTLENTKLIGENNFPALYVDGNTSHIGKVSISGDAASVSGTMMKGQQTAEGKVIISITGGTYSSDPSKYVAEGYFSLPNENSTYTVVTADQITSGVTIQGIAGYEHRAFATVEDAFTTVKTDLEARCGLVEQPMDEAQFNAFFTDGGKITWTIYGEQAVTDNRTFSFGRAANRFGEGRHITEINIIGGNDTAALNLSAVNGTFALPYNWWNVADSANTALKCKNIKFNGIKSMPSGIYQCTLHPTTYEFDGCTFNGNLYSYQNFDVVMTIKNSTFNAPDTTTQYAFMSQGVGGTITLDHNNINGYTRGVNLERATANFVFTNNTITSTVSEPDRAAIQLTDGKQFVVTGNIVDVNAGNAFWFHNAATNSDVTYTISDNNIKAAYIGYSGTSFNVNEKITTSSGNKFNNTDTTRCMKKGATVAEATNLTAIH